jgi:hypothetical protein
VTSLSGPRNIEIEKITSNKQKCGNAKEEQTLTEHSLLECLVFCSFQEHL